MYEITKHEFAKWQSLLQKGELTKYEKTLLSQITQTSHINFIYAP